MWIQWAIAGLVAAVGLVAGLRYLRAINVGKHEETAPAAKRRDTHAALLRESSTLSSFETPEFLLSNAVDLYERKHAAIATLDDKSQKLVALIGGGASLFALLGGFTGNLHATLTPLLVLSILCFFAGLVLLLFALRPVETDIPAITEFNSASVLVDPAFRAKVARRMIEAWQEITLGLTPILRRKGRLIFVATVLIVAGASLLLTNFLLLVSGEPSAAPVATIGKMQCNTARSWAAVCARSRVSERLHRQAPFGAARIEVKNNGRVRYVRSKGPG